MTTPRQPDDTIDTLRTENTKLHSWLNEIEQYRGHLDRVRFEAVTLRTENGRLRNEINTLRAQLVEAQSERDSLRKAVELCKNNASGMRMWDGMGWVYHPPQAKRIYEIAEAALAATRTGKQHDNFCT